MKKITAKDTFYFGIIIALSVGVIFTVGEIQKDKVYLHIALKEHANDLKILIQYQPDNPAYNQDLNNTNGQIYDMEHNHDGMTVAKLIMFFGAIMLIIYIIFPLFSKKKEESK